MNDSDDGPIIAETVSLVEAAPKPRVWDVFLITVLSLFVTIVLQAVVAVCMLVSLLAGGMEIEVATETLMKQLTAPPGFMMAAALGQLAFGVAALVGAKLSPRFASPPLGMGKLGLPIWGLPLVMVGALFPLAIGIGLAHLLTYVIPPDPSVAMLYEQMTAAWAIPFILFIAFVPGFMEEIFFRGYMQRRLLRRWSPSVAILVTSIVFGLFHVMPHAIVFATVIGLWLGVVAYRTDSIWPTIACHAFINGIWNVWNIGIIFGYFPEETPLGAYVIGAVVILGCFLGSVWLMWQVEPENSELNTVAK